MKAEIGQKVIVAAGASRWMKERNYWLECMGDSIDGMEGTVIADYTTLPGDDAHYGLDLGLDTDIGVNPQWLAPA